MSEVKYGLRDDVAITLNLFRPGSSHVIAVKGRIRDVVELVNAVGWKISGGQVDIDEFLKWQNQSLESTTKSDENG